MNEIIYEVLRREAGEIENLTRTLDEKQVGQVTEMIKSCAGKIILSACGTSAQAARKIAHTLCCIGCPALFLPPSDALHGGLGVVEEKDVLILISKGGCTREINEMVAPARKIGVKVLMVTEHEDGRYARESDAILKIGVRGEPDRFNMLATASTLAVIAVFDAICIDLMNERRYTKEDFARVHPEGEVGKRLAREE